MDLYYNKEKVFITTLNEAHITIGPAATTTGSIELFTVEPPPGPSTLGIVIGFVFWGVVIARLVPFFSKK